MNTRASSRTRLGTAIGMCLASLLAFQAAHASGDGSLVGRLNASEASTVQGAEITARNPATGFTRTVRANEDGSYRFPFLPVGEYALEAKRGDVELGRIGEVRVNLGAATTANFDIEASSVDTITVTGSRVVNAIDVSSTESATNLTRADLDLLPVERDLLSVASLAPGINRGEFEGISFGGSSVAENTVYINGLNVTDFYRRVGSSTVPYAFYQEFQVKTGGYSVEFGRTTGGVINAVTRSGTNEFEFGTEVLWEPDFLQSEAADRPQRIASYDEYDRRHYNVYASGPIVKDKLFFFALYEFRDYQPTNTSDVGDRLDVAQEDDGFWGTKLDWQINDRNLLELLAFSDENVEETDNYRFDAVTGTRQEYTNTIFDRSGGTNWAATYTAYLTESLSGKVLYGENERDAALTSRNDIDCARVRNLLPGAGSADLGCTASPNIAARNDTREARRIDFEWDLGKHLVRFGWDHEINTSVHDQFYPGPERLLYEVRRVTTPNLENGAPRPAGVFDFVRTRQNEVDGTFESTNSAYYVEDNWSITDDLVVNAGLRLEAFDNKNGEGGTYIEIDDMLAPRLGFSWDVRGDARTKLFGNAGRYFLPVANVINIKQAGRFLDARRWYPFNGFENFEYNGVTYQRPILGSEVGSVDMSQGDGTVGDLRGEVDADLDPVFQDELILGFQSMLDDRWSWGVRGIYRKLNNAIDDMEISSTGTLCGGEPVPAGFVMGNPGEPVTVFADTDCDDVNDSFVTIDTAVAGWALFDDAGNYAGEVGYDKPNRSYKALELVLDRAWDRKWSMNATYTLSYSRGNAEGPVNSDTDFSDTGRTEAFDDPWVNLGAYGDLPNDHRHQFKLRGSYGFGENWRVGASINAVSGRPISAFGEANPFDTTNYHSYFICTATCDTTPVYELRPRGTQGRTPWTYDVSANLTWQRSFGLADVRAKLAVYNLLNAQRVIEVHEELIATMDPFSDTDWGLGTDYQEPRYAQLTFTVDF
jgi:hypothetical protein